MRFLGLAVLLTLPGLAYAQDEREVLRREVLRVARDYATFEWRASKANVMHGDDIDGVRVDTPDAGFDPAGWRADGAPNHGMPYCWGGFTSIDQFQAGLRTGALAGLVPATERARASRFALGLDCSGYVSRCFDLPVKQTTRSLNTLCYPLDAYDDLQPGDVLNQADSHVALFVEWTGGSRRTMRVLEAGKLGVTESIYVAADAKRDGFRPLRYRLLDLRWRDMTPEVLGKAAWRGDASSGPPKFVATRRSQPAESTAFPLQAAKIGSWATYSVTANGGVATLRTWLAAAGTTEALDLQCIETIDGKVLPTGCRSHRGQNAAATLVELLAFYEPVTITEMLEHTVEVGTCTHRGRQSAARKHAWHLRGSTTVRHQDYPLWLDASVVVSDEVPLFGVLTAEFDLRVDWGRDGSREDAPLHRVAMLLEEFGQTNGPSSAR